MKIDKIQQSSDPYFDFDMYFFIFGQFLLLLYQKNKNRWVKISNLAPLEFDEIWLKSGFPACENIGKVIWTGTR